MGTGAERPVLALLRFVVMAHQPTRMGDEAGRCPHWCQVALARASGADQYFDSELISSEVTMELGKAIGLVTMGVSGIVVAWVLGFVLLHWLGNDLLVSGSGGFMDWLSLWLLPFVPVLLALAVCFAPAAFCYGAVRRALRV